MEPSRRSDRKRSKPLKLRSEEENDSDESTPEQTPKAAMAVKQKPSSSKSKTKSRKTKTPKTSSAPASATPKTSSAPATATQLSSTTASKSRGKQTKKKTRTKVGRAKAFSAEELEAARNNAEEREAHINDLVKRLDVNQCRDLLASIAREQPGIVLEMMDIVSAGDEAPGEDPPPLEEKPGEEPPPPEEETGEEPPPPPPARPSPRWCRCGNCRIMQTALEDQCCGYNPDECLSNAPEMQGLCLDPQVLNLNMLYRADILAVWNIGQDDPHAKNRSFRHAAYRQHILWHYGRLRRGERKVIASCCVWKIRDRYPDPSGQYVPFMPGRL